MADKTYVLVKCDAKDLFDSSLKSGLVKAMEKFVEKAIENRSNGKLTTKGRSKEGFLLTVILSPLKADNKAKPTKIAAKVGVTVLAIGSSAKAFTGSANGAVDGFGSNSQSDSEDLAQGIIEDFMPKVIKTILKL
jgi:hypothetical protein